MFLMGIPVLTIMAISGHKTEKSFRTYIKASGEEHAQIMRPHWENNELKKDTPRSELCTK